MTAAEPAADGRRLRSERSRTAVIEALLGLYDAGIIRPTVAQIAEASGVSERSVFRHFTDLEDLAAAAIERQVRELLPYFAAPDAGGPLDERIAALVDQRLRLHARLGNLARAAAFHAVSSPTIAAAIGDRRALLRGQVARQFAPELDGLRGRDRRAALAALDQAVSIEAIDYFAATSGGDLNAKDLRRTLTATLAAMISPSSLTPSLQPLEP